MDSEKNQSELRAEIEGTIREGLPAGSITPTVLQGVLVKIADAAIQTRETAAQTQSIVAKLSEKLAGGFSPEEVAKMRTELMGRMDSLHDDLGKQRLEMQAIIELLRDSSPAALLVRIRQLEDELRELRKGES